MAQSENDKTELGDSQPLFKDEDLIVKPIIKYPVGCDVDKELIFSFPYIIHEDSVSYIENHAHVMFIIRGPPSTGKASLSEMLTDRYPNATHCCADHYFSRSFANAQRSRESIKDSHVYCQKRVETACLNNAPTIIVQNTHMRKWEMQVYLDFAALYNYTVVMAITLYRFDCTPKALAENNTDGLDIRYFQNRLRQWEDVVPMLTGWFVSPDDSLHILQHTLKALVALLGDGKFCRIFNIYDADDVKKYFNPRILLCCLAGYAENPYFMKAYYLSNEVQNSYGKCFTLSMVGYLVSKTAIMGIVNVNKHMKPLILNTDTTKEKVSDIDYMMSSLQLQSTLQDHGKTTSFPLEEEMPQKSTVALEDWEDNEVINTSSSSFIHLAQKDFRLFDIKKIRREFQSSLKSVAGEDGCVSNDIYSELGDGEIKVSRLPDDVWLIKPAQKISIKSVFTGLYV